MNLFIDNKSGAPIYEQLYTQIKNHEEISINRDELVPGCNHVGTEIAG